MPTNIFDLKNEQNFELRELTKNSICFLPISVGQKYHLGDPWRETIRQMNQYFKACIIVPVDGLHRFTEMMKNKDLSEEKAEAIAVNSGNQWLSDVDGLNKKLCIPNIISRWSDWVSVPEFQLSKKEITECYNNEESDFRDQVDIVILNFITSFVSKQVKPKKEGNNVRFNLERATELCKFYLLEELAFVDMLKKKNFPTQILKFFNDVQLEITNQSFFMAYPFGHNSTNDSVYNCFQNFCSENLGFINLSKPPKQPKKKTTVNCESTAKISTDFSTVGGSDELALVVPKGYVQHKISGLQNSSAEMHVKTSPRSDQSKIFGENLKKEYEVSTPIIDSLVKNSAIYSDSSTREQEKEEYSNISSLKPNFFGI